MMSEQAFWVSLAILGAFQGFLIYSWFLFKFHKRERKILKSIDHYPTQKEHTDPMYGHRKQREWQRYLANEVNTKFQHLTKEQMHDVQNAKMWYIDSYSPELDRLAQLLDALEQEMVFMDRKDVERVIDVLDRPRNTLMLWLNLLLLSGGALLSIIAFVLVIVMC